MRLEVLESAEAAARRGAEVIATAARGAVAESGRFACALSGGSEPLRMFELLGAEDVMWDRVELFQVDERVAPEGDHARNLTHLLTSLPEAARGSVRPMPVSEDDLEAAARSYEAELPRSLDLIHLGIGPDGHTASLVPGDPVLEVADRRVALTGGEYQGRRRMTLTYPALARATSVMWLIPGSERREPLRRLLERDPSIPAGRVDAEDALVVADADAVGEAPST